MSRNDAHIHGSRRLRRALGLSLSGAALVGLIYFEGLSARAEAGAEASLAEQVEDAEADELDAAELEAEAHEEAAEDDATASIVPPHDPMILPPSGAAMPSAAPATVSPTDGRLAMATVTHAVGAADATMPPAPPAPALVAVPDIEGLSLRKAKKQLAAVGLKLAVRDEYGDRIPREYWSEYKVRTQKLDAGTEVAPGSTVKVKARMRMRYAMGY